MFNFKTFLGALRPTLLTLLKFTASEQWCTGGGVHLPDGPPLRHGGADGPGGDGCLRQCL